MTNDGTRPTAADIYRRMLTIRRFEEKALELGKEGHVAGSIHLCLGQEAIPVGAAAALRDGDKILSTYRGHGWALAAGAQTRGILAEIAQRAGGVNGGRAGSPMLSDPDHGFLGENSIIGAGLPIADGVAMAEVHQGTGNVVLVSLGDGAMNQGGTTEAMVFAAARSLPVIFVCENNGWSEMTPITEMTRGEHLARRAQGLGIEARVGDGGDPRVVTDLVTEAAALCRAGHGPVFLEFKTVRLSGHYNKDIQHYRPAADIEAAQAADPLVRWLALEDLDDAIAREIDEEVTRELAAVADEVVRMPEPDPAGVFEHLYAPPLAPVAPPASAVVKEIPYYRAVNEALREALGRRDEVLVYGEDVGFAGGIFGVTRGLQKDFGAERVFDTPIAEAAILGSAVGAAMRGLRPVVEIMWADFVFVALDQIINQASNVRYINRSKLSAPMVIRMQQGVTPGSCAQHSQSIEAILAHIPGIKVGMPTTPQDAYAMTLAAIEDPDPVVLIEHRSMYQDTGAVQLAGPTETAAGAVERRAGDDLAIISWGSMVTKAQFAAAELEKQGVQATVLDLRWLRPLDDEAIERVVRRCGRVVIAHEAFVTGGLGAEVSARIGERWGEELHAPVVRVGTRDVRMPSAPALQDGVLPTTADIVAAAHQILGAPARIA